jgi:hypothetical protein
LVGQFEWAWLEQNYKITIDFIKNLRIKKQVLVPLKIQLTDIILMRLNPLFAVSPTSFEKKLYRRMSLLSGAWGLNNLKITHFKKHLNLF